jgi:adenine/guanine/hypoxanthine permease
MRSFLYSFFGLKARGTTIPTEFLAGLTTFFTMAYIIIVNPMILSGAGMDKNAVFTATIIAAAIGTLVMGLYANVPYAQAPGMGLNAFFAFSVVLGMSLPWQQAIAIVFFCGILNIIITVTRIRKMIILAIPESLQYAISAGIGLFIAYIGFKNAHFLDFIIEGHNIVFQNVKDGKILEVVSRDVIPEIVKFKDPSTLIALFGLVVTAIMMVRKIKGSILLGILLSTVLYYIVNPAQFVSQISSLTAGHFLPPSIAPTFMQLQPIALFTDHSSQIFSILAVILAFSLTDTFDTIGTFLGTGRASGIFDKNDEKALRTGKGFSSRLDKALFADATATSIGSLLGTSNVTTYIESASGIGAGGRTGLTSVFIAIFFLLCLFIAPIVLMVPGSATAPALIVVGILMMSSAVHIKWNEISESIPAFMTAVIMPFTYSITNGIAAGFIFYTLIKVVTGKAKTVHPLIYIISGLFLLNYLFAALH